MSASVATNPEVQPTKRRRRRPIVLIAVVAVVGALVAVGALFVQSKSRPVPSYPALSASPDASLKGTVAYFADETGCVRVMAVSGQTPARDVLCIAEEDPATMVKLGKTVGPQLVWLPDGRLEVTMFRFDGAPPFRAGWQKVVDVRTGTVVDTPAADVPSTPNLDPAPTVSPSGETVSFTSDRGEIAIVLTDAQGARTLMSAQGPPDGYGLSSVFWSPDYQWIFADDGRILVVTPDDPSVVRVLTDETDSGMASSFGEGIPRFAATTQDVVPPSS